jgi:hypothetical protein
MIRYPGGEVAFWTTLWMLAGGYISYTFFQAGEMALGVVFAVLPIASLLIWFDVRQAKWLIIAYCGLGTTGGCVLLITKGIQMRIVGQMVGAIYTIVLLWRWNGGPARVVGDKR